MQVIPALTEAQRGEGDDSRKGFKKCKSFSVATNVQKVALTWQLVLKATAQAASGDVIAERIDVVSVADPAGVPGLLSMAYCSMSGSASCSCTESTTSRVPFHRQRVAKYITGRHICELF